MRAVLSQGADGRTLVDIPGEYLTRLNSLSDAQQVSRASLIREAIAQYLAAHAERAISVITWMEVLTGATPETEAATRAVLGSFTLLVLDERIAERAVAIRRRLRIKLSDALIKATAEVDGRLLVSRNIQDFPPSEPGVRVLYQR